DYYCAVWHSSDYVSF
nr:immunoglobulin light chain junction region [Macaca mulatta]